MTLRLRLTWPDASPFAPRRGRPIRLLAISDEPEPALESEGTRRGLEPVDLIVGCGDLQPEYLTFVADAFGGVPLIYVRGNHDTGAAWEHEQRTELPEPLADGQPHRENGLVFVGFSGSARYNERGMQVSGLQMWLRVLSAWPRLGLRRRPVIVLSHSPPRGLNDGPDRAHRGFSAFRWLARRLAPPLWLHGHTSLVRRGLDERALRSDGTLFYNCTGATLVELHPPDERSGTQPASPGSSEETT